MDLLSTFLYFFPMFTVILMGIGAALFIGGYIRKRFFDEKSNAHSSTSNRLAQQS